MEKIIIKTAGTVSISLMEVAPASGNAAAIFASAGPTAAPDIIVSNDSDKIVGLIMRFTIYPPSWLLKQSLQFG